MSHSFTESILEWSHLNLCPAYLGGDFFVSLPVNADTEILLTYPIAFLTETVQLVWT